MARSQNKRRWSSSGPRFVQLFHYMLETGAWRSLTAQERSVYTALAAIYNGTNNGRLGLSVRGAAELAKVSKDTAARALQCLQERGFIECVTPGGFSRKTPHAAEWRLTAFRCDRTEALPSKAFRKWRPPSDEIAGPKRGRCGPKLRTPNGLDVENVQ